MFLIRHEKQRGKSLFSSCSPFLHYFLSTSVPTVAQGIIRLYLSLSPSLMGKTRGPKFTTEHQIHLRDGLDRRKKSTLVSRDSLAFVSMGARSTKQCSILAADQDICLTDHGNEPKPHSTISKHPLIDLDWIYKVVLLAFDCKSTTV